MGMPGGMQGAGGPQINPQILAMLRQRMM